MTKKLGLAILIALFLSGCDNNGSGQSGMMGSGMMGSGGMMGNINIPSNQPLLEEGSSEYVQGYQQAKITCTQCHALPNPNLHSSVEWPNIIVRMKNYMTYGKDMPSDSEMQSIIKYYAGNSK